MALGGAHSTPQPLLAGEEKESNLPDPKSLYFGFSVVVGLLRSCELLPIKWDA